MNIVAVLGAQNDQDGTLSQLAVARAETALAEYRRHRCAMMLVTGGYGQFNPAQRPHAHYVAQYLLRNGLHLQDLLPLALSANTVEDAVITRMIAHGLPMSTLYIVTSEHHLDRARLIFEHFFPPGQLAMVSAPCTMPAHMAEHYLDHERKATATIRRQGGVFVSGLLIKSAVTCPNPSELLQLLAEQGRNEHDLISIYRQDLFAS